MTIEKSFLICGSPHFSDYYTFSAGMQEIGITDGCAIFTFAMDGACHMAAIWAKQAHIPCSRIPLSDFILGVGRRRRIDMFIAGGCAVDTVEPADVTLEDKRRKAEEAWARLTRESCSFRDLKKDTE